MPGPLESVRARLVRAGVPRARRERLIAELCDHVEELREQAIRAGQSPDDADATAFAQLGKPEELAAQAVRRYRSETFAGRHPVVWFGLAPLLAWSVSSITLLAIVLLASDWFALGDDVMVRTFELTGVAVRYAVPALLAIGFYRRALAVARGHVWGWVGALVLSAPGTFIHTYVIPSDVDGQNLFEAGLGLVPSAAPLIVIAGCLLVAWLHTVRQRAELGGPPPNLA